jgi:hypothetical protein
MQRRIKLKNLSSTNKPNYHLDIDNFLAYLTTDITELYRAKGRSFETEWSKAIYYLNHYNVTLKCEYQRLGKTRRAEIIEYGSKKNVGKFERIILNELFRVGIRYSAIPHNSNNS